MSIAWQEKVTEKRRRLLSLIPHHWILSDDIKPTDAQRCIISFIVNSHILTDDELTITTLPVTELIERIASGQYTAVEVCQAYCHRAAIAQQLVNCLTEINFEDAKKQAEKLDFYYRQHRRTIGPLHGLPVSLKDQFRVKGLESSIGYVSRLEKYDEEESTMTECLRDAGAIIYVKTTVPQSLMIGETISNIFGTTFNPYNRLLSCGGSSGGEGALIALHGSPIGLGTDIGGSIRIPAAFNGLFGLKSSAGRFPLFNITKNRDGQESIRSIGGPIAHNPSDLAYFMRAILEQKPWNKDPDVLELPWREESYQNGKNGLKTFGIIYANGTFGSDGVVMPHPPVLRAIRIVINALRKVGHTVIEWHPYKHGYGDELIRKMYSADGGVTLRQHLEDSGEPLIPYMQRVKKVGETIDIFTLWKLQHERTIYQKEYLAQWHKEGSDIDAWILPIAPHAAVEHEKYKYGGYSTILNLLDWPGITVPVTFADREIDSKNENYQAMGDLDASVQNDYDPDIYHGAPVSLQLVGRRLQEEYLIGLTEQVNSAVKTASL